MNEKIIENDFIKKIKEFKRQNNKNYIDLEFNVKIILEKENHKNDVCKSFMINGYENLNLTDYKPIKLNSKYFPILQNVFELISLSKNHFIIKNLIEEVTSDYIILWLNINGNWKNIILDQIFPVKKINNKNIPYFLNYNKNFWIIILEKALAKIYYSYNHLNNINEIDIFKNLLGCPVKSLLLNMNTKYKFDKINKKKNYIYYAQINNNDIYKEMIINDNFYKERFFLIKECIEIIAQNKRKYKILKISDKNNYLKWNGDFSKKNYLWSNEKRKKFYKKEKHFWIKEEDFLKYFKKLLIIKEYNNYYFNSIENSENKNLFKLFVLKNSTKIYFQLTQFNKINCENNLNYNNYRIYLLSYDHFKTELIYKFHYTSNNQYIEIKYNLNEGHYFLLVENLESKNLIKNYTIGTYSNNILYLEKIKDITEFENLKNIFWKNFIIRNDQLFSEQRNYNINSYKITQKNLNSYNFEKINKCKIWIFLNKTIIDMNIKLELKFKNNNLNNNKKFLKEIVSNDFNYFIQYIENEELEKIEDIEIIDIIPTLSKKEANKNLINLYNLNKNFDDKITYLENKNCNCNCIIY